MLPQTESFVLASFGYLHQHVQELANPVQVNFVRIRMVRCLPRIGEHQDHHSGSQAKESVCSASRRVFVECEAANVAEEFLNLPASVKCFSRGLLVSRQWFTFLAKLQKKLWANPLDIGVPSETDQPRSIMEHLIWPRAPGESLDSERRPGGCIDHAAHGEIEGVEEALRKHAHINTLPAV